MRLCEMLALLLLVYEEPAVPQRVAACSLAAAELLAGPSCELNSWTQTSEQPLTSAAQLLSSYVAVVFWGASVNKELEIDRGCVRSGAGRMLKPGLTCHASASLVSRVAGEIWQVPPAEWSRGWAGLLQRVSLAEEHLLKHGRCT